MLKVGFSESTMFKEGRPLWGLKFRANEGRGQTCLDYAKCSRIWRNSKKHCVFFYGGLNNEGRAKHAPSGGRKFVQTRAEDKLVWTMPSAAGFGETQKIA